MLFVITLVTSRGPNSCFRMLGVLFVFSNVGGISRNGTRHTYLDERFQVLVLWAFKKSIIVMTLIVSMFPSLRM